MPISVACKCGQKFAAKDNLAGKAVKCPKCGSPLKIPAAMSAPAKQGASRKSAGKIAKSKSKTAPAPAPAPAPSGGLGGLLDEAGFKAEVKHAGPKCPSCNEPIHEGALICVECGYNLETGRQIGSVKPVAKEPKQMSEAEKLVARAAEEIKDTPITGKGQRFGTGVEAYIFFFGLLIVTSVLAVGVAVYLRFATQEYANDPAFMVGTIAGIFLFMAWIDVLGRAFADKLWHGIAAVVFFPYALGYAMYRSVNQIRPIVVGLIGANLAVFAWMLRSSGGGVFLLIAMVCADLWFIAAARIVGMAFDGEDGQKQGLLCLLVPGYKYVFGFIRRGRFLIWTLIGLITGIIALVFIILYVV